MLPIEFIQRMKQQLPADEYDSFIQSFEYPCHKALRLNPLKTDATRFARDINITDNELNAARVDWEKFGYYYVNRVDDISSRDNHDAGTCKGSFSNYVNFNVDSVGKTALHAAGVFYVQEPSAMLPANMLNIPTDIKRPLRVLDLCAAPGGKSTQIAGMLRGEGVLVSNEIVPQRARILAENIERMGVCNAIVISADPEDLKNKFAGFFDRILVDAPCSGEGMFRRIPEATDEWSPENVRMCANRQDGILDCAAQMLAYGGRIVYSTCTFSPDEDEDCMNRFLNRHPEFAVAEGPERIWPHKQRGEGHFSVAYELSLTSDSASSDASVSGASSSDASVSDASTSNIVQSSVSPKKKKKHPEWYGLFCDFASAVLTDHARMKLWGAPEVEDYLLASDGIHPHLELFKDHLYLIPAYAPSLSGIKVMRAGLELGEIKKERFEPAHALSHALSMEDVVSYIDLSATGVMQSQYRSGLTLSIDLSGQSDSVVSDSSSEGDDSTETMEILSMSSIKGWCLICVNGYGLGWGKATGGTIKNHYPKIFRL